MPNQPLKAPIDPFSAFISTMMVVLRGSGFPPSRLSAFVRRRYSKAHRAFSSRSVLQLWSRCARLRVSSLTPVGVRSASLLEGPPGLLLTLRPAIVVSLREAQGFLSHACRRSFGVATRRPTGPSPHAPSCNCGLAARGSGFPLSRLSAFVRRRYSKAHRAFSSRSALEIQLAPGFVDGDGCAVGEV